MQKPCILGLLILLLSSSLAAQNRAGILPQINLNISLPGDWRGNAKLESRQIFHETDEPGYRYERTDLAFMITRKTAAGPSWGAGYMVRLQDGVFIHRTTQQYSAVSKYSTFRLGHRLVADQTFRPEQPVEYRFRYRASSDFPLQGQSVDPGEFYLKVSNEYLGSFEGPDFDLEIRGLGALGFNLTDNNKFELGLDYRVNAFLTSPARHNFWGYLGWFVSI
jgi:hypothetical protein